MGKYRRTQIGSFPVWTIMPGEAPVLTDTGYFYWNKKDPEVDVTAFGRTNKLPVEEHPMVNWKNPAAVGLLMGFSRVIRHRTLDLGPSSKVLWRDDHKEKSMLIILGGNGWISYRFKIETKLTYLVAAHEEIALVSSEKELTIPFGPADCCPDDWDGSEARLVVDYANQRAALVGNRAAVLNLHPNGFGCLGSSYNVAAVFGDIPTKEDRVAVNLLTEVVGTSTNGKGFNCALVAQLEGMTEEGQDRAFFEVQA